LVRVFFLPVLLRLACQEKRLTRRRLAMKHAEIQREHREDEHIETDSEPD